MATIDDYCEARSSDESDAGSLEDFIAGSDSEEEGESSGGFDGTPPCSSEGEPEVDVANIIATRRAGSLRRSTRTSKAPVRYVDDDYIRLMTEDANAEDAVSSEGGSDEYGEDDEEDEEYDEEFSESETSSDAYSSDEDSSELRVVSKKRRLNSSE